jgi:hypothetical protein
MKAEDIVKCAIDVYNIYHQMFRDVTVKQFQQELSHRHDNFRYELSFRRKEESIYV